MAEQAILSVSLKDYKKKIDELRGALLGLEKDSEDYKKIAEQLRDRQDKLNEVMSEGKEVTEAVDGSYNALSATMSKLKKEWKNMEIGTKEWEEMAKQINNINDQLKDADSKVGVFSRNVGDYANAFEEAFKKSLDGVGKMGGTLGSTAQTLKNLVPIIKKTNDTATKGLGGIKKAIVSTGIGALVVAVGLLLANWDKLTKLFRKDKGTIDEMKESNDKLNESFSEQNRLLENEVTILQAQGASVSDVNSKKLELIETQKRETQAIINATKAKLAELQAHSGFRRLIMGENGDIKDLEASLSELEATMKSLTDSEDKIIVSNIAEQEKAKVEAEKSKQDAIKKTYEEEKKLIEDIKNRIKEANKDELKDLEDKYKKEKELMKKYGMDTSELDAEYQNNVRLSNANSTYNTFLNELKKIQENPFIGDLDKDVKTENLYKGYLGLILGLEGESQEIENIKNDFAISMANDLKDISEKALERALNEIPKDDNTYNVLDYKDNYDQAKRILYYIIGVTPLLDDSQKKKMLDEVKEDSSDFAKAYKDFLVNNIYTHNLNETTNGIRMSDMGYNPFGDEKFFTQTLPKTIVGYLTTSMDEIRERVERAKLIQKEYKENLEILTVGVENLRAMGFDEEADKMLKTEPYLSAMESFVKAEQELLALRVENWKTTGKLIENASTGMLNIWGSVIDIQESQLKQQGKTDKEIFEQTKSSKIAMARVNSIEGALAAFMGYQELPQPYGAIVGAIQAAAVLAAGQAQIEQIKATKFDGAGGTLSNNGTQNVNVVPRLADYTPEGVTNLTGASDTDNLANAIAKTPIKAYVVESEVTAAQSMANQREIESSF